MSEPYGFIVTLLFCRFRRACPKGSRGRAKRGEGTMDSEHGPPASSASSTGTTASSTSTTSSSSAGRQAVPHISVYSGIPDRQTVQVNFRVKRNMPVQCHTHSHVLHELFSHCIPCIIQLLSLPYCHLLVKHACTVNRPT